MTGFCHVEELVYIKILKNVMLRTGCQDKGFHQKQSLRMLPYVGKTKFSDQPEMLSNRIKKKINRISTD